MLMTPGSHCEYKNCRWLQIPNLHSEWHVASLQETAPSAFYQARGVNITKKPLRIWKWGGSLLGSCYFELQWGTRGVLAPVAELSHGFCVAQFSCILSYILFWHLGHPTSSFKFSLGHQSLLQSMTASYHSAFHHLCQMNSLKNPLINQII